MALAERFEVRGLADLEKRLKMLRDRFDTRTGGIVIRGLRAGAKLIRDDARRRVRHVPSGFSPVTQGVAQPAQKGRRKRKPRSLDAILRSNIVEHAKRGAPRPTVLIRVRNHGYTRVNWRIRFNRPGSSPGWWWWMEFGTSKTPAQPFMRPAAEAQAKAAVEAFRQRVSKEIDDVLSKNRQITGYFNRMMRR